MVEREKKRKKKKKRNKRRRRRRKKKKEEEEEEEGTSATAVVARKRVDTRARARERARGGARTCVRACPCGVLALRSFTVRTHACTHAARERPRNARACLEAGTRGLLRLRYLRGPFHRSLLRLKITGDSRNSACIDQRSPPPGPIENIVEFYCHNLGTVP